MSAMKVSCKSIAPSCLFLVSSCLSVPFGSTHAKVSEVFVPEQCLSLSRIVMFCLCTHMSCFSVDVSTGHPACVCLLSLTCCDVVVLLHAPQSSFSYAVHSQIECSSSPILN